MQIIILSDNVNANAFILYDEETKEAAIFDPGSSAQNYLKILEDQGLDLKKIILTHGHFDHIGGVEELREKTGAKVYIPEKDKDFLTDAELNLSGSVGLPPIQGRPADVTVSEGDEIEVVPGTTLRVIETPGHTPGGACFVGDGFVIVGDILFQGSIGRTDFPGGSYREIMDSIGKLMELDDDTIVLPGHGNVTRIGIERVQNPFLNQT